MKSAPWWYRFLVRRIDTFYEISNDPGWIYWIGGGYETFVTVLGRERGWMSGHNPKPGVPAWLQGASFIFATAAEHKKRNF